MPSSRQRFFRQLRGRAPDFRTTLGLFAQLPHDARRARQRPDGLRKLGGDQRGGTCVTISKEGEFTITPTYAKDVLANYATEYYIDYDQVAAALEANPKFESGKGHIARGTDRKWKLN